MTSSDPKPDPLEELAKTDPVVREMLDLLKEAGEDVAETPPHEYTEEEKKQIAAGLDESEMYLR